MMATDFLLNPSCSCGSSSKTSELYGSNCKHMTLCLPCGQDMARNRKRCSQCGAIVTRLIREYNIVRAASDKSYFIGKFPTGLPSFTKKKGKEESRRISRWCMSKIKEEDGKSKQPWLLDEVNGQCKYQSKLENMESGNYYLLVQEQGSNNNVCAVPAGSWFNFNKVAQYKQLTLEEAEELMNKTTQKRNTWMMKSKKEKEKVSGGDSAKGEGGDEEEEKAMTMCGGSNDEDEEKEGLSQDEDEDDDDRGDDWEHEDAFTDDDETACVDKQDIYEFEGEANGPELPEAIKQIEDDVSNEEEEAKGLSAWGVELKELLKRRAEEEDYEDEDDEEDMDEDIGLLLPKQKVIAPKKLEPLSNSPKQTFPSVDGKRKLHGDAAKTCDIAPPKKMMKTENGLKSSSKKSAAAASLPSPLACSARRPVSEEAIKAVFMRKSPVTAKDFVENIPEIKSWSPEEMEAFRATVRKLSVKHKKNGINYFVLKEK